MANHRAAALLIASLLVAVAVADARLAARHHVTRLGVHHDARGVHFVSDARLAAKHHNARLTIHRDARGVLFASDDAPAVPALSCSSVHGMQEGETCFSVAQGSGLTQDDFLGFNPNINCKKIFVGQWVCLAAVPA